MAQPENDLFVGVVPFVVTAETRSFRQAAERLGLTPSGVSKAISRLEAELGTRLLDRSSRSVALTEEGAAFLRSCQDAVINVQAARERLSEAQRIPRGLVTLSLPLMLGRSLVLPALTPMLDRYPQLTLRANLTDRLVRLSDERVDLAIRIGHGTPHASTTQRKLADITWKTVASPAYIARRGKPESPAQLAQHECLAFLLPNGKAQPFTFANWSVSEASRAQPSKLIVDHGEALIEAAIAGVGIVQAHDYAVAGPLGRGELLELLTPFAAEGPPIQLLIAPGKRGSPRVRVVVEQLLRLFAGRR
ncbi:MAG: LysR family transcriptional regulator [Myxococcales bacterium]